MGKWKLLITLFGFALPSLLFSQVVLYNGGGKIHVDDNAVLFVDGDYFTEDGTDHPGKLLLKGNFILAGDWINNSSGTGFYPQSSGVVSFAGLALPQRIGGSQTTVFPSLRIDKPGVQQELLLQQHSVCLSTLFLEDDVLNTRNFDFTVANPDPGAIQRSGGHLPPFTAGLRGGYVTSSLGKLHRKVDASQNGSAYLFPVGSSSRWIPVSISAQLDSNQYYGVRFVDQPPQQLQRLDSQVTAINPDWYHQVERTGMESSPQEIRIYYDASLTEICDPDEVGIAQFDGSKWIPAGVSRTEVPSTGWAFTTLEAYSPVDSAAFVATDFALAGMRQVNGSPACAFPPELLLLNLDVEDNAFQLTWETQAPPNISGYLISRSTTGLQFFDIGWANAISDSLNPTPYEFWDLDLLNAQPYFYRIEEIDLNGGSRFSNIVQGILEIDQAGFVSSVFPNPAREEFSFWVNVLEGQSLSMTMINGLGQEVFLKQEALEPGLQQLTVPVSSLAAGVYWLSLHSKEIGHSSTVTVR